MTLKLTVHRVNDWDNGNERILEVNTTLSNGNTKKLNVTFRKEDVEKEYKAPDGTIRFDFKEDAKITFYLQSIYLEVTDKTLPDMMKNFSKYDMISQEFLKLLTKHVPLPSRKTHLHLMIPKGRLDVVRQYLSDYPGADVSDELSNIAGRGINADIICLLLEYGSSTETAKEDCLSRMVKSGYLEVVKVLIEHGVGKGKLDGLIQLAINEGQEKVGQYLEEVKNGPALLKDHPSTLAKNHFYHMLGEGNQTGVQKYLSENQVLDISNELSNARGSVCVPDMMSILLEYGFSTEEAKESCLSRMVESGYLGTVKVLIEHGVGHGKIDGLIQLAKDKGHERVEQYLEESKGGAVDASTWVTRSQQDHQSQGSYFHVG